jgi:hypothetical protein
LEFWTQIFGTNNFPFWFEKLQVGCLFYYVGIGLPRSGF